jgi:hypothetical protein
VRFEEPHTGVQGRKLPVSWRPDPVFDPFPTRTITSGELRCPRLTLREFDSGHMLEIAMSL